MTTKCFRYRLAVAAAAAVVATPAYAHGGASPLAVLALLATLPFSIVLTLLTRMLKNVLLPKLEVRFKTWITITAFYSMGLLALVINRTSWLD